MRTPFVPLLVFLCALPAVAATQYTTTLLPVSDPGTLVQAAVGDVDGDGRNELVVVSPAAPASSASLRIYEIARNGAATLDHAVELPAAPAGDFSYAQPRIADLDRDGDLDIALYLRADGQPGVLQTILWDQSAGGYQIESFVMPESDAAYGFDMADVDGDGLPDAVTANHGANAPQTLFVSYAASGFTTSQAFPLPFQGSPDAFGPAQRGIVFVYARDVNADGRTDLFASTAPYNDVAARLWLNLPAGFVVQDLPGVPAFDIAAGDHNNDGKLDLLMTSYDGAGLVRFQGPQFRVTARFPTPPGSRSPIVGDFDLDGRPDVAVVQTLNNNVTIMGTAGAQPIATPELAAADFRPDAFVQSLTAGDVDNDGRPDLVFATDRVILIRSSSPDTVKPVITVPAGITAEATSAAGADITWSATAVDDRDGAVAVQCAPASGSRFAIGTTSVTCTARDAAANVATASFNVTVRDTTAPAIASVTASQNVLWPPNGKFVTVTIGVTATDATDAAPVSRIVSVSSNQPANGKGDGNTSSDWSVTGPLTLTLRAERSAILGDRVYTITVECRDRSGNASRGTVNVTVPR
ncbi:MAG TPA: FG-GAP-like repeat-containing protein [Thermoanaerobaculia bacterium]|jgi:hypothetical protein